MTKIKHLVVDSGAFIKNAPIHEYAENIYTVDGAIKEIKDKATRQRLQFLPYTLKVKDPSPDSYKYVLEFSKKTGDFSTLSVIDLQIIALTYQLEKENVGTDHLNEEPSCKVTSKPTFNDNQLSGFYHPKEDDNTTDIDSSDNSSININTERASEECNNVGNHAEENNQKCDDGNHTEENYGDDKENEVDYNSGSCGEESESEEEWITSSNIAEMQKKMQALVVEDSDVCVACISTDFSIQNVLRQIGLHVISVDGMLIKNTRVFILRCYACYKTTNNISKQFCPNCGNKTLKRVAITYNKEGSKNIHINFRKPINVRGTRYSLPLPKGGKHAVNPVLCEDQRTPHNRPAKMALQKIDVLGPDFEALSSPFTIRDVYSRAASLGIRSNKNKSQKKNPNEWSIRTGNKKQK